ncbi:hypothetical protein D9M71_214150 [compost metagenome]
MLFLGLELFLLFDQPLHLGPQFGQAVGQLLYGLPRALFFTGIMAAEGLQQCVGPVPGMLGAATDRAGLIVLQLAAQLLDAGAAGQALALKNLQGDAQCLLGSLVLGFNGHPFTGAQFPLFAGLLLGQAQGLQALFQFLATLPVALQFFEAAQLQAAFLQVSGQGLQALANLLGQAVSLAIQGIELLLVGIARGLGHGGPLFDGR